MSYFPAVKLQSCDYIHLFFFLSSYFGHLALDQVLFEDVLDGGGEEGAILNDGTTTEGEDWNGYTSGDFY